MRRILIAFAGLLLLSGTVEAQQTSERQLMYELMDRLEQLEQEVRQLRGAMEVYQYKLDEASRSANNRYQDTDRRLQALEGSGASGTVLTPSPDLSSGGAEPQPGGVANQPAIAAPAAATTPGGGDPRLEYDQAFAQLREGAFDDAVASFGVFLQRYPDDALAGNAQYWLGEAHYVNRDFDAARGAFQAVLASYPASAKVPDAKLKLGFTLAELKQTAEARRILQEVRAQYPDTNVARLAERRLSQL
jgi:tol-pal system protein YbgF